MAAADLTAARLRELLTYDPLTGSFTNRVHRNNNAAPAGAVAGTASDGYILIGIDDVFYRAHRLAWLYVTGDWPRGDIDHKNRRRDDNRWSNLREASRSLNMQNVLAPNRNNSTGYRGVMPHGPGYRAQIMLRGKTTSLGTYATPEAASKAYLEAKAHIHAGAITEWL